MTTSLEVKPLERRMESERRAETRDRCWEYLLHEVICASGSTWLDERDRKALRTTDGSLRLLPTEVTMWNNSSRVCVGGSRTLLQIGTAFEYNTAPSNVVPPCYTWIYGVCRISSISQRDQQVDLGTTVDGLSHWIASPKMSSWLFLKTCTCWVRLCLLSNSADWYPWHGGFFFSNLGGKRFSVVPPLTTKTSETLPSTQTSSSCEKRMVGLSRTGNREPCRKTRDVALSKLPQYRAFSPQCVPLCCT